MSSCFEALKSTKISSYEPVSSQKYENGYRTKICNFTESRSTCAAANPKNWMAHNWSQTSFDREKSPHVSSHKEKDKPVSLVHMYSVPTSTWNCSVRNFKFSNLKYRSWDHRFRHFWQRHISAKRTVYYYVFEKHKHFSTPEIAKVFVIRMKVLQTTHYFVRTGQRDYNSLQRFALAFRRLRLRHKKTHRTFRHGVGHPSNLCEEDPQQASAPPCSCVWDVSRSETRSWLYRSSPTCDEHDNVVVKEIQGFPFAQTWSRVGLNMALNLKLSPIDDVSSWTREPFAMSHIHIGIRVGSTAALQLAALRQLQRYPPLLLLSSRSPVTFCLLQAYFFSCFNSNSVRLVTWRIQSKNYSWPNTNHRR